MNEMPASECWLHPNLEVRASPVDGVGLFSNATIEKGEIVSRLGGRLVSTRTLRELIADADRAGEYVDTITFDVDINLVLPPGTANGRGNHSCDPNTWWVDAYTLVARRTIAVDDEVTNDYATSTGVEDFLMSCRCGAPGCRRRVTGTDWKRADLRTRYGDHWVPALLARIHEDPHGLE